MSNKETETITAADGAELDLSTAPVEQTEEAKPTRPALTVHKIEDIQAMDDGGAALLAAGKIRAAAGLPVEYKEDPNQEDGIARAANGRKIRKYVAPRDPNVVASEELQRLQRLPWAITVRQRCAEIQAKRKTPLSEDDVQKVMADNGAPKSYHKGVASKKLFGRVFATVTTPLPATAPAQT